MSQTNDLIARLEAEAEIYAATSVARRKSSNTYRQYGEVETAGRFEKWANDYAAHAADIRAAAAAVRLVGECKAVVAMARQQFDSHAGEQQNKEHCEQVLASLSAWESSVGG